ncbi:YjaG family protein [Glaesserella sp.]|uniref:YjaG family protein n=3 Tax=Glaesserella sp. TaxID=2094731 RepID=UPI0035A1D201
MQNPIHKRIERFDSWQHLTFMACLCERMYPNFKLFCDMTEQQEKAKIFQNILNLVWESLTVKGVKINFENQLEKLEAIIPDVNEFDFYGVFPAEDACEALSEILHSVIAGSTLEQAIKLSRLSLATVATYLETQQDRILSEQELKNSAEIQDELDVQWQIYRLLNECEERNIELILGLKNEIRESGISNIGLNINQ